MMCGGIKSDDGTVILIEHTKYPAHNLAWLYVYGEYLDRRLEHIDGNKFNNTISNLRRKNIVPCAERAAQIALRKAQRKLAHNEKIRMKAERQAALEAKQANQNECITQDELKALLDYDPVTGIFTHKMRPNILPCDKLHNTRYAGKVAGTGKVISLNGRLYGIGRLASLYQYGTTPPDKQVKKPRAEKKAKTIAEKQTKIPKEAAKELREERLAIEAKQAALASITNERQEKEERRKLEMAARLAQEQRANEIRVAREQRLAIEAKKAADELAKKQAALANQITDKRAELEARSRALMESMGLLKTRKKKDRATCD